MRLLGARADDRDVGEEFEHVETFRCMGCTLRVVVGAPTREGMPGPRLAAKAARAWLEAFDRRLSRFRPGSETSELNSDARERVPASALLRSLVGAGLWAAERSGGLVDPTLLPYLEAIDENHAHERFLAMSLAEALELAPRRHPAAPDPDSRWRRFHVDNSARVIERPTGLAFDPGGIGKGLAADAVAFQLQGYTRFAVDCSGDLRLGGTAASWTHYFVNVPDPVTGATAYVIDMEPGAVATSGFGPRVWRRLDGALSDHLLDPSTGESAWTGVVSATALAPTTLEAQTLAKTAFLSGPRGARRVLKAYGGVTIRDNGAVELHGALGRPHVRVRNSDAA